MRPTPVLALDNVDCVTGNSTGKKRVDEIVTYPPASSAPGRPGAPTLRCPRPPVSPLVVDEW